MLEKKRRNSQRSSEPTLGSLGSMASMNSMIPQKSGGKSDTDALRVISVAWLLKNMLLNRRNSCTCCRTATRLKIFASWQARIGPEHLSGALRSTLAANLPAGVELPVPADGLLNVTW